VTGAPVEYQRAAGVGPGWSRLATALRQVIAPPEIAAIWVFHPVRREDREWGTAIVVRRADPGRVRIYTARFMRVVRGRERGQGKTEVEEVGSGPAELVDDLVRGVQERAGETDPPASIAPELWYREDDDQPAAQG
jgi:hypothetical protein